MQGAIASLRCRAGLCQQSATVKFFSSNLCNAVAGTQLRDLLNNVAENSLKQRGQGSLENRYQILVSAGTLRPDVHQAACVQRLDQLCEQLKQYAQSVEVHSIQIEKYTKLRQERWQEAFDREEKRFIQEELQTGEANREQEQGEKSLRSMLGIGFEPDKDGAGGSKGETRLSAHQRHRIISARAELRLDEMIGSPPAPPAAPRGVYIHGSVGSGKSLLMDLLYTTVMQQSQGTPPAAAKPLSCHRRLHFNAALLELHSRLHELDRHREEVERQQMEAYAHQAQAKESGQKGGLLQAAWQQLRDPIAEKLKRTKLAKLAYRRMMRDMASRSVEEHSQALARSNSAVLRHAARALIRNCDTLELMHQSRRSSKPSSLQGDQHGGSPLALDTGRIAALLCFDELQVNDVFNAVALKGLMEALIQEGCVVVATSNRAPWELNRHGLHEDLFDHFVSNLLASCDVVQLDAEQDYRRLIAGSHLIHPTAAAGGAPTLDPPKGLARGFPATQAPSYFYPLGPHSEEAMRKEWEGMPACRGEPQNGAPAEGCGGSLSVMFGRRLDVRRHQGGAAWFEFEELCGRPLGAADYIAISQAFHTVFLEGVPAMSMKLRDRARRFITLIDELYNHRVRLVCSAEVAPDELFTGAAHNEEPIIDLESLQFETAVEGSRLRRNLMADGGVAPVASCPQTAAAAANLLGGAEERFAFARAVSRLYEMQAPLYLQSRPRG